MPSLWYAFHSQPHKEDLLWQQLLAREIENYYPRVRVQAVNPRARKVRPYFPGYLFVRSDLAISGISTFQYMPFAVGLVAFGGEPAPVPDALIKAIQNRVAEITSAGGELFDGLKPGEEVLIQEGPFSGYEAIFDTRISGTERVRILLKMLGSRQVPVELHAGHIKRKRTRSPRNFSRLP